MAGSTDKDYQIIKEIIKRLNLDLTGKTVLSEIGSGAFMYIGLIASMAGAKKVQLWTKDSEFGLAAENMMAFEKKWAAWGLSSEKEISVNTRPNKHIKSADIITNSGFIRPLDAGFLNQISPSAVIAYMAEAWEYRPSDIDLEYCHSNQISVAGTWENHPDLKIFDNCGPLALKMIHDAGLRSKNNRIGIISNDHFGPVVANALKESEVVIINTSSIQTTDFRKFDLLFIADYSTELSILGENGILDIKDLNGIDVVHLSGQVNIDYCKKHQLNVWPEKNGLSKKMTFTLAYLGIEPVIHLHAAGLKVGELLHNKKESELVQKM